MSTSSSSPFVAFLASKIFLLLELLLILGLWAYTGIGWFAALLLLLLAYLGIRWWTRASTQTWEQWGSPLFTLINTICLTLLIKTYFIGVYRVPTRSMMDTLLPGDIILVNKLVPGLRVCQKNAAPPFTNCRRYFPLDDVSYGDLVVFNHPGDPEQPSSTTALNDHAILVKRIAGMPGDSLSLSRSQAWVNHQPLPISPQSRYMYRLEVAAEALQNPQTIAPYVEDHPWLNALPLGEGAQRFFGISLTYQAYQAADTLPFIQRIRPFLSTDPEIHQPDFLLPAWNQDSIPTFYLPKANDPTEVPPELRALFQSVFTPEQEGPPPGTFPQGYFFLQGDNPFESSDSRIWGLVPEHYLIGRVMCVIFSYGPDEQGRTTWRWDRLFKGVQ